MGSRLYFRIGVGAFLFVWSGLYNIAVDGRRQAIRLLNRTEKRIGDMFSKIGRQKDPK